MFGAVRQMEEPTAEEVNKVQVVVLERLQELFEQHKHLVRGFEHKTLEFA